MTDQNHPLGVAQAVPEPAAWQVRGIDGHWLHVPNSLVNGYREAGNEVRPLYAAQPPAAPVETDAAKTCNSYLQRALDAEADALRLHNEKMDMYERAIEAEAKLAAHEHSSAETGGPTVIDFDDGEISVRLNGKELRGWSYSNADERRTKMLAAREYVEGWCDGRTNNG